MISRAELGRWFSAMGSPDPATRADLWLAVADRYLGVASDPAPVRELERMAAACGGPVFELLTKHGQMPAMRSRGRSVELLLDLADVLADASGVEVIRGSKVDNGRFWSDVAIAYVNVGDLYTPSLNYFPERDPFGTGRGRSFEASCIGEYMERPRWARARGIE